MILPESNVDAREGESRRDSRGAKVIVLGRISDFDVTSMEGRPRDSRHVLFCQRCTIVPLSLSLSLCAFLRIARAHAMREVCIRCAQGEQKLIFAHTLRKRDGAGGKGWMQKAPLGRPPLPLHLLSFHRASGDSGEEEGWQLGRQAAMQALLLALARECAFTMAIYSPHKEVLRENLNLYILPYPLSRLLLLSSHRYPLSSSSCLHVSDWFAGILHRDVHESTVNAVFQYCTTGNNSL